MKKIFLLLTLLLFPLYLHSRSISWGNGNVIDISYQYSSEIDPQGDNYLFLVPHLHLWNSTVDIVPLLRCTVELYRGSSSLLEGVLKSLLYTDMKYFYFIPIKKEYLSVTNKIVLTIGPDRGIVKNSSLNDAGTFLDSTYVITFYGVQFTNSALQWDQVKIIKTGGIFYPWNDHEDILFIVNAIVQTEKDKSNFDANFNMALTRLGSLDENEVAIVKAARDALAKKEYDSSALYLRAIAFNRAYKLLHVPPEDYYDVEKIWVWGKAFYDLLMQYQKADEWDNFFIKARDNILIGKDVSEDLLGAMASVQSVIAKVYSKEATKETPSSLVPLVYFFQQTGKGIGYSVVSWINDLMSTKQTSSSAPLYHLYDYWEYTINYSMKQVESGQKEWMQFIDVYMNLAEDWIFDNLGGDVYSDFRNDFNMWKSAVLAENYSLATTTRNEIMEMMNALKSMVAGEGE